MDHRYKKYSQRKFRNWKSKVKSHLPEITISFYNAKNNGIHLSSEDERLLGKVINWINDPMYTVQDSSGNLMNDASAMLAEVCLEILVNDLFKLVNTKCINNKSA